MIVIIFPIFALPALLAVYFYSRILKYYMITSREIKRIEAA
jgi:hypothetical protein